MKKFVAIYAALLLALLCLLSSTGYACPEVPANDLYTVYTDPTVWAQDGETLEAAGMLNPWEAVATLALHETSVQRMRGFLPGGVCIRVAAKTKVFCSGDQLMGAATLRNSRMEIENAKSEIVQGIVWQDMGEGTEICGGSISACILHFMADGTAAERLATQYTGFIIVGRVYFNVDLQGAENDYWLIVACDWDKDGDLELCLLAGSAPEEAKEPEKEEVKEPEKEPDKEPEKEADPKPQTRETDSQTGCSAAQTGLKAQECVTVEVHWSFDLLIKNCRKLFGL